MSPRKLAAGFGLATALVLGAAGVAGAQVDYTPDTCAVDTGQPLPASCVQAEVEGTVQSVSAAGTLPYTGSDSSVPLAQIGVGLLAVGGGTVLVVKRRNAVRA